ncbi:MULTISPECIES: DUF6879 family protein [Streptomycetaceae]|uniref:DUF6879 domain-containing protein n=1 Tax=Streptantibioticus cattleyicolor (strain ATCC 35852 / DSM 46488 / JCM 4925 / NBRC 14057 / NRRL 8057) TaxID=1003195 RepID=F8K0V1_STREN|nr:MULTISPECIES: DUF6879 family protein [Streptomycetaceae]AEW93616.1 hypothetical protein SCATT_12450 [Streptantibioticus cattleyicolor NRRL 8057 = DSM 46488]MYS58319.1 hypothetical protein [Streptomyces sp. SID5468]CCB73965.1 conserved protein of unknown function [Streptantibioticus cattleyicolor NRRL 8057 = DSM 46488]
MPRFISDESFDHYFGDGFAHTAWRLETRRGYASDREGDGWQRFLRGEADGEDPDRPWCRNIRAQVARGKRVERVRLVDDPPTIGQRFLLYSAATNVAAGEDIRGLFRAQAEQLGLPMDDFWLFDSRFGLRLHFDESDTYLGAELVTEPAEVLRWCQVRDAAWHHAMPYEEFRARVPATA